MGFGGGCVNVRELADHLNEQNHLTEKLQVRLSPHEQQVLKDYCWRYDIAPSDVVRFCLEVCCVIPDWGSDKPK